MPDAPKKTQSKIRTFAQDLNAQREKRGEKPVVTSSQKSEPEVIQMAKGPSETVTRKPEPKKEVPPTPEVKPVVEVIPVAPTPEPTKIPAFHELQDAVAAIQKNTETQQIAKPIPTKVIGKKSSAIQNAPRVNIGYDAKVITDTKKKQFHLFPAIAKSLRGWFAGLVKPRKKATPTYSVPDASRRKGVIQKATSKTGSMFTAENTELKEKIRQRKIRAEEEEEKARLAAAHEPETTWSPFTETGYELLEEPDVAEVAEMTAVAHTTPKNVTIEYKKQRTIEVAPPREERVAQEVTPEIETIPEAIVEEENVTPETVPVNSEDAPQDVPVQIFETEEKEDFETDAPVVERTGINRFDTNTLAIMFVVLIGAIALLVVFIQFTLGLFTPTQSTPAPFESNKTISGAQTKNLTLQENQSLTNLINQSVSGEEYGLSDSHIYSQNGNLVSPALVIELLQFDIQANFRQSLTDVSFVHLNQSKPLFVFEFVDEPTVRGGFLAWETNMPEDLQSFYSIPLQNDYSFTDQTVGGIDVRVLLSETGQTLIVYGIVNENTALISSSLEDFSQVVETSFTQ